MNEFENTNSSYEAVKAIVEAALQSCAIAGTLLSLKGDEDDTSPSDIAHRVVSGILANLMHANGKTSAQLTVEFVNGEDVKTEVHYDYLDHEGEGENNDRLDPFAKFFEGKDL